MTPEPLRALGSEIKSGVPMLTLPIDAQISIIAGIKTPG
jgi:hypothetical protein